MFVNHGRDKPMTAVKKARLLSALRQLKRLLLRGDKSNPRIAVVDKLWFHPTENGWMVGLKGYALVSSELPTKAECVENLMLKILELPETGKPE